MTPKLSLVTGTINRRESLQRLVNSIIERTTVSWELVISDASESPAAFYDQRIRVIHEVPRLGCTKGFNQAFRATRGEFVIWLNDDAEVCERYDVAAIEFMEAHSEIGLGALHYSEDGGPFHVNSAWKTIYANFGIFRRFVGASVGFFDEDVEMYGCDNSLAIKILLQNYGVADIADARVIHHSVKDQTRVDNQRKRARDNEILTAKYMPSQTEWVRTFNRLYIKSGVLAWNHGRRPEAVTA